MSCPYYSPTLRSIVSAIGALGLSGAARSRCERSLRKASTGRKPTVAGWDCQWPLHIDAASETTVLHRCKLGEWDSTGVLLQNHRSTRKKLAEIEITSDTVNFLNSNGSLNRAKRVLSSNADS